MILGPAFPLRLHGCPEPTVRGHLLLHVLRPARAHCHIWGAAGGGHPPENGALLLL
jgi:hypothetical protein